jgi:hypothetical protein
MPQHDQRPLIGVERGQGRHQLVRDLPSGRPRTRGRSRRLTASGGLVAHLAAPPSRAQQVERAVHHDPVKPRAEGPPAVEAVERPHRRKHRLLRDVLRCARVVDDQERGPVCAVPVAPDKRLDRVG